ncbi:hypothetical protein [Cohnella sp. 56]|uniref:hypothetical protein n=1 Tax=Cohnella sp. 56 TaxID=3113722 RepID=UPI0030E91F08
MSDTTNMLLLQVIERLDRIEVRVQAVEEKVDRIEVRAQVIEEKVDRIELNQVEDISASLHLLHAKFEYCATKEDIRALASIQGQQRFDIEQLKQF